MGIQRCWGLDKGEVDVEKGRILRKVSEMEKGFQNVIWRIWSLRKQVVP